MAATKEMLPSEQWADLLGIPHRGGGRHVDASGIDCWGLILEVYRRRGIRLPDVARGELPSDDWQEIPYERIQPGDVVLCSGPCGTTVAHVALFLGAGWVLQAPAGRVVERRRLSALRRAGRVLGYLRPSTQHARPEGPQNGHPVDPYFEVHVAHLPDPLRAPARRSERTRAYTCGMRVRELVDPEWLDGPISCAGPDGFIPMDQWDDELVQAGASYLFLAAPEGVEQIAISLILIAISTGISYAMAEDVEPEPQKKETPPSPAWDLDGLRNTSSPFIPIPVVYGEHRVAGNIIQSFWRADSDDRAVLHMLIALSAGPIHSVAGIESEVDDLEGRAIPSDIEFDNNPASGFDGSRVSIRLGENDQSAIPGFNESITSNSVGASLRKNVQVDYTTTSDVERIEVLFEFPRGHFRVGSGGGTQLPRTPVQIQIQWRKDGGGATSWNTRTFTVDRARRSAFTLQEDIDVSSDPGVYELRVTRLDPEWPEENNDEQHESIFSSVNEITEDEFSYPGIALLGVKLIATDQVSGAPPNITSVIKGRKVWVWDGVDPNDPNFGSDAVYSSNPAWCVLDALLNPIYGLARYGNLTLDNIDLEAFDDWADYCDTTPNVNGSASTEKRAELDIVIGEEDDGWDVLLGIARSSWATLMLVGDKITPFLEKTGDPVALFSPTNTKDFRYTRVAPSMRKNVVEVEFLNEDERYGMDVAVQQDDTSLLTNGDPQQKKTFRAVGVTRPVQAFRVAQFHLQSERNAVGQVEFTAGPEAVHLLPWDIIRVAHEAMPWGTPGRARAGATTSTIKLDRAVTISAGDVIQVRTSGTGADVIQERTPTPGSYAAGDAISISPDWDAGDTPAVGDPFSVGSSSKVTKLYRIVSINLSEDLQRQIVAREYVASVYDDDPGEMEDFTEDVTTGYEMPGDLTDFSVVEVAQRQADGSVVSELEVHFRKNRQWESVEVWWRLVRDDGGALDEWQNWIHAGTTRGDIFRFATPYGTGEQLEISAVPVSPKGTRRHPRAGSRAIHAFKGRRTRPTAPSSDIRVEQNGLDLVLYLPPHDDSDVDLYDVRAGRSWACALKVGRLPPGVHRLPMAAVGSHTIRVRAVNRSGVYSWTEREFSLTTEAPSDTAEDISYDERANSWPGTQDTVTEVTEEGGSRLELQVATDSSGSYTTDAHLNADGTDRKSVPLVFVEPKLDQLDMVWEEACFAWDSDQGGDRGWDDMQLTGFENTEFERWDDLACTWEGTVGSTSRWDGGDDLFETLEPTVEWAYSTTGATGMSDWERYLPHEQTFDAVQVRVSLNAPSGTERYVPQVWDLVTKAVYKDASQDGHEHTDLVKRDGTRPLTADWDIDAYGITTSKAVPGSTEYVTRTYVDTVDAYLLSLIPTDHHELAGRSDDDHSIYIYTTPTSNSRNVIQPSGNYLCLTFADDGEGGTADKLQVFEGTAVDGTLRADISYRGVGSFYGVCAPGTAFPSSPEEGMLFFRTDLDEWFFYDSSRSKWLSVRTWDFRTAINSSNITALSYMRRQNGMETRWGPFELPYDMTIVEHAIGLSDTVTNTDVKFGTYSGSFTAVLTVNRTSAGAVSTTNVNTDFSAGDPMAIQLDPTPGSDQIDLPVVDWTMRRRAS